MNEPGVPVAPRDNPYFGLEYYDERFGAWFFGRQADGSKVITNLRAARLTLLHAESGVGKSSLLRAGVAWRMRRLADDMFARRRAVRSVPVVFTSWKDDPCRELAGCVAEAIQPYLGERPVPALPADRLDLALEVASAAVNANLLIMLDQFEEYFLYRSREPVPERFADQLACCVNRTDLRANFLIAVREDAYAGLGDLFKGRIPNVYGNYLHIDYLDRAAAEQAIREPLAVYNRQRDVSEQVRIEDDLVKTVLDEVRAFDGDDGTHPATHGTIRIATPLLQLVMERVWNAERAEGSHELRYATLQKLRGVRMIADAHLGKALGSLGKAERQTAIDMFDHLVTPSGGKIAESVSDLARRTGHSEQQVSAVLTKLDRERIVRPVSAAPGQDSVKFRRYEIFHDVLAPTINRAITARDERRRSRRTVRVVAVAAALLILSSVTVLLAYLLVTSANERLATQSHQLAAEAQLYATSNPTLSTQLALAALHLHYTPQAEDALRAALPGVQTVRNLLNGNGTTVNSAAFDPADPNKVVSSDRFGIVSIREVTTGALLVRVSLADVAAQGGAVSAFNPSGTEVAIGYGSGMVAVFDARTGRVLRSAIDGSAPVNDVAFLGSTGTIAIASQQNLALWQPGAKCCDVLSLGSAGSVAADPADPRRLVSTTGGAAISWTIGGEGQPQRVVLGSFRAPVSMNDAGFSPDGKRVVAAESDGSVKIYTVAAPSKAPTILDAGDANALTAAFSPDGKQIVAGYSSGTARVWDVSTRLPLTLLAGNAGGVLSAEFSPDGSEVVTAGEDGTARVWYAQPRELQAAFTIPPDGGTPNPIAGTGYVGDRIIAADQYGHLEVFTERGEHQATINDPASVTSAAWSEAGTKIVTADALGGLSLWQAAGPDYVLVFHTSSVNGLGEVGMSADGSRVANQAGPFAIQIRSTGTGQVLRTLSAAYPISVFAVAPGGREVVAGNAYGQVEAWNGTARNVLGSSGPQVLDIAYSRSGSEFVVASANGVVTVWDAADDQPLLSINACQSPGTASFSPDGGKIVVACGDGTVRVFETATGRLLVSMPATSVGVVSAAAFSPDGRSIVAAINAGNTGYVQVLSSELATPSLAVLEHIAAQRVPQQLTPAQQQQYLNDSGG